MKNIQTMVFAVLLCMATLFTSCIHNDSVYGGKEISQIKFSDSLKNITADKFDTLNIEAPPFKQINVEKPVQYEWEVNYKKVGDKKVLKYVCDNLGKFSCRLKISNEDGSAFYGFDLLVKSPYYQGLMVLSSFKNQSMLSFKREDVAKKTFYKHVYADNNPTIPLGNTPVSILHHNDFLYFASNNPARILKVDEKTMETVLEINYEGKSIGDMKAAYGVSGFTIMGDGVCYDYEATQDMFMGFTMKSILDSLPNAKLSNRMTYVLDSYNQNYPYFYDDASGTLLTIENYDAKKIKNKNLQGKKLLQMISCSDEKEILMLLQEVATSDIYLAHYIHETYTLRSIKKISLQKGKKISACVAHPQAPLFYYSIGNKVYVFNYLGENFPDKPQYSVGNDAETIASMLFSPTQERLYIGLNRKDGDEYNGDVFCFDSNKKNLLWSERGVAGEIIFMNYKQEENK